MNANQRCPFQFFPTTPLAPTLIPSRGRDLPVCIRYLISLLLTGTICFHIAAAATPPPGTKLWEKYLGGTLSVPSIGHSGHIYLVATPPSSSRYGVLHALAQDGTPRWQLEDLSPSMSFDFATEGIVVCPNGNLILGTITASFRIPRLIFPDGTHFYRDYWTPTAVGKEPVAVMPDGDIFGCAYRFNETLTQKLWVFDNGFSFESLVLGTNGTQYVFSNVQNGYKLYSISPGGLKNWEIYQPGIFISPLSLDRNDNIIVAYTYTNSALLCSFSPLGRTNWMTRIPITSGILGRVSQPIVGVDGTIYISFGAIFQGSDLWAVRADGTHRWNIRAGIPAYAAPAAASDGTLVAPVGNQLLSFDITGRSTVLHTLGGPGTFFESIVLDSHGVILAPATDGYLYAIQGPAPLASSGWPMRHHDPRHTSSRATPFGDFIPTPSTNPPFAFFPKPADLVSNAAVFVQQQGAGFSPASREFLRSQANALGPWIDPSSDRFLKRSAHNVAQVMHTLYEGYSALTAYQALLIGDIPAAFLGLTSLVTDLPDPGAEAMMNGVEVLYTGVSFGPVYGLVDLNAWIWGDLLPDQLEIFGNDPPSLEYSTVFQPNRLVGCQFRTTDDPYLDASLTNAVLASYDAVAFLKAANRAFDRYAGAYAATNAKSATLQLEAFLYYLALCNQSLVKLEECLFDLREDLVRLNLGNALYTPEADQALRTLPLIAGIHPDTEAVLLALGMSGNQVRQAEVQLESIVLPDVSGTLAQQVGRAAAAIGAMCVREEGPEVWFDAGYVTWFTTDTYILEVTDALSEPWRRYEGLEIADGQVKHAAVSGTDRSVFFRLRKVRHLE